MTYKRGAAHFTDNQASCRRDGLQPVGGYAGGEEDGCPMTNVGHDGGASFFCAGAAGLRSFAAAQDDKGEIPAYDRRNDGGGKMGASFG